MELKSMAKKGESKIKKGPFEDLLKEFSLHFDPKDGSFTITVPSLTSIKLDNILRTSAKDNPVSITQIKKDPTNNSKKLSNSEKTLKSKDQDSDKTEKTLKDFGDEYYDVNLKDSEKLGDSDIATDSADLEIDAEPVRVKIHLKAYLKLALHAIKYANPKIKRKKWVEVIGLLVGNIENQDTPLAH